METLSALLAIYAGNSPVPGEFPAQRPMTRSFDVFFDLRLNKQLSKQSWGWWFETLSRPLWRHCNETKKHRGWVVAIYDCDGLWIVNVHGEHKLCIHLYMYTFIQALARITGECETTIYSFEPLLVFQKKRCSIDKIMRKHAQRK